MKDSSTRYLF